ncbi:MAG: hypothetical protein GVY20_12815 [Bacteroidetes bacterium]|jgi:hypothetical protein|nr:hypothetical protein [Bacteroidota bacterium]
MASTFESPHTLVIARFNEDISWIRHVPKEFSIRIYNKGEPLSLNQIYRQNLQVSQQKNIGRESETYIRYLKERKSYINPNGYSVFTQADPFEHSPDFLKLLLIVSKWKPIQPLSFRYKKDLLPPDVLLNNDKNNFVADLRVRLEPFSVYSMDFLKFHDEFSIKLDRIYRTQYDLKGGTNLSEHFLNICGLPERAELAASNLFGQLTYGAIFAVQNSILTQISRNALESMHSLSKGPHIQAYMFERHWLHIVGYPFFFSQNSM